MTKFFRFVSLTILSTFLISKTSSVLQPLPVLALSAPTAFSVPTSFTPQLNAPAPLPIIPTPYVVSDPGKEIQDALDRSNSALNAFENTVKNILIKNALNVFLAKLAYDAAVYAASAGTGQQSLVYNKPVVQYLADVSNSAAGAAIQAFATKEGLSAAALCDPGNDFRVQLNIGLQVSLGQQNTPYKPACTLTELTDNWSKEFSDPNFSKYVQLQYNPAANPLGIALSAQDQAIAKAISAQKAAQIERTQSDFKAKVDPVSGYILTPASEIQKHLQNADDIALTSATQLTENAAVNALDIFTSTLVTKLALRAEEGIANLANTKELGGLIGGGSAGSNAGPSGGRAAAEATFADLKQVNFSTTGSFDILADLATCPASGEAVQQSVNNCAMGTGLEQAVNQGWTVQQFLDYLAQNGNTGYLFGKADLDSGSILGDGGITSKGILLLKQNRIAPVGWQLADDYIQHQLAVNSNATIPTLQQLASCYDVCGGSSETGSCSLVMSNSDGSSTNYSPYCHLVDPTWVLKAPQNFCQREAAGPDFVSVTEVDNDSNQATQESLIISRANYCADSRSCINESISGACSAYGYCTQEQPVYHFKGEQCQQEYSSCGTFTNANGEAASYIANSLDYNDCATHPGCQWYCTSKDASDQFNCASSDSTNVSCNQDTATQYGLAYPSNASCGCSVQQTCQVTAGSDPGAANSAGLHLYTQCLVTNNDTAKTQSVCTLPSVCGANSPTYNATAGTCTCTLNNSCTMQPGVTSCNVSVTTVNASGAAGTGTETCNLPTDTTGSNQCNTNSSSYTQSPVCQPNTGGSLNCGDTCIASANTTSCVNNLGNTCTLPSSSCTVSNGGSSCVNTAGNTCVLSNTCADAAGCSCATSICTKTSGCSCAVTDSCAIPSGASSCTSANGNKCIIGAVKENPVQQNITYNFDQNVKSCNASDAGCSQYVRLLPDTNIVSNAFFTVIDTANQDTYDDQDSDHLAFCTNSGKGCYTAANCGTTDPNGVTDANVECKGWNQTNLQALAFTNPDTTGASNKYVEVLQSASSSVGQFSNTIDTGHDLYDRTFTFSYRAKTPDADVSSTSPCTASFSVGAANGGKVFSITTYKDDSGATQTYQYTDIWQDYTGTVTFPGEGDSSYTKVPGSTITVTINSSAACNIDIAGTQLQETSSFDGNYADYATNNVTYLNGKTVSCQPADVGCLLYTPKGKNQSDGVPGIITNANSANCVKTDGSYDYGNPQCNQCDGNAAANQVPDYNVGCGFFSEAALTTPTPVSTNASWLSSAAHAGVAQRSGNYCSNDNSKHCLTSSDCTNGGSCQPLLSIVPASGKQCALAEVGCEAYTNLDAAAKGGETTGYYTQLQQCVKANDNSIATFHTFEGSDTAGVQIQDYALKVAADGSPCTHLDPSSQNFNADCVDGKTVDSVAYTADDCTSVYGANPDCRQYVTETGDVFYRYESQTILASDSCTALRNDQDQRIYYAIPNQSNSCSVSAVGCREYQGSNSGTTQNLINESFASNSTTDWTGAITTSNESVENGAYSLSMVTNSTDATNNSEITHNLYTTTTANGATTTTPQLQAGDSYTLTFWAEVKSGGTATFKIKNLSAGDQYFSTTGSSTTAAVVKLDPYSVGGWQAYQLGPIILSDTATITGNEQFALQFTGATITSAGYISNIKLTQSDSQYLIQDTAHLCQGFEGCQEYKDAKNSAYYLKSFKRLCSTSAINCEAMTSTVNSANPFTEGYNLTNEYTQDDTIVQADKSITVVYNPANQCVASAMGCTAVGLPTVSEQTKQVQSFQTKYFLNQPDSYSKMLCQQPQLACSAYATKFDGTLYFKAPGDKTCGLKKYSDGNGDSLYGWFKAGSSATQPDCPVQHSGIPGYSSQPLGGVCNSNSIHLDASGKVVEDKVGILCQSDVTCYPNGWTVGNPVPRCITSIADDVDKYAPGTCVILGEVQANIHSKDECNKLFSEQYNVGGDYSNADWSWTESQYPDDGISLVQRRGSDFGWVGQCPSEQTGCSQYVDSSSPNVVEGNKNASFENDAFNDTNNALYTIKDVPNGFPDYWTTPNPDLNNDGNADYSCTTANQAAIITASTTYQNLNSTQPNDYPKVTAADGQSALRLNSCLLQNSDIFKFDPSKTYTLQAYVKIPANAYADATAPATFSIGLQYYKTGTDKNGKPAIVPLTIAKDGLTVQQTYLVANHSTIPANQRDASTEENNLSAWYHLEGNIGIGSTVNFPSTAQYAVVFVTSDSGVPVYFDAVSFKPNDVYYYINSTVDGTSQHQQIMGNNSCTSQTSQQTQVTSDGSCVAFRDTAQEAQTSAQNGLDCSTCLLAPTTDTCRAILDSCDSNTLIKVTPDRTCSQWLACATSSVTTDVNGKTSTECLNIQDCTKMDANNHCILWAPHKSYNQLIASDALNFTSAPGVADSLLAAKNLSGYSTAGLTWGAERVCSVDSAKSGQACSEDSFCADNTHVSATCGQPFSSQGYYPYGWMAEIGQAGLNNGHDLIEFNDFEQLFCGGDDWINNAHQACLLNATKGDDSGKSSQCYRTSFAPQPDTITTTAGNTTATTTTTNPHIPFEGNAQDTDDMNAAVAQYAPDQSSNPTQTSSKATYYCPNNPAFLRDWPFGGTNSISGAKITKKGWAALGGSTVFTTQYDTHVPDCVVADGSDSTSCDNIDENNVLAFQAANSKNANGETVPFTGGVSYDLESAIKPNKSYTLSFNGRYQGTPNPVGGTAAPSAMSVCFNYANVVQKDSSGKEIPVDLKDCFVNGLGSADVVFAIDSSGSMQKEVTALLSAVSSLATSLSQQGIDARFALVSMDGNQGTSVATALRQNFTDVDTFKTTLSNFLSVTGASYNKGGFYGHNVDPFQAVDDVVNKHVYNPATGTSSSTGQMVDPGTLISLKFRTGSRPFTIVVTDTTNESGSGNIGEDKATQDAKNFGMPVYVVTSNFPESHVGADWPYDVCVYSRSPYDELTTNTGGAKYTFSLVNGATATTCTAGTDNTTISSDWSQTGITAGIFSNMVNKVSVFQLSKGMRTYTFGPLTTTNLGQVNTNGKYYVAPKTVLTTTLEFTGYDATETELDNVSLLPALEVSKNLPPISRNCRAYPSTSATSCNYITTNGNVYQGWEGYCLMKDPTDTNRCITWWPVDLIDGQSSIANHQPAGYQGRSNVYQCLVAKGYEQAAFCDAVGFGDSIQPGTASDYGSGILCSGNDGKDAYDNPTSTFCKAAGAGNFCLLSNNYVIDSYHVDDTYPNDELNSSYSQTLDVDGGYCQVDQAAIDDADQHSCTAWPVSGICLTASGTVDTHYNNATACNGAGGHWETTYNLFAKGSPYLSHGKCYDYTNTESGQYDDPLFDKKDGNNNGYFDEGEYCFYDLNGDGIAELRSTRSCADDNGVCTKELTTAPTQTLYCGALGCTGGSISTGCSVDTYDSVTVYGPHSSSNNKNLECNQIQSGYNQGYNVLALRWQLHDPVEEAPMIHDGSLTHYNFLTAQVTRLPANAILRNIHASEIETVELNTGAADDPEKVVPYWGQVSSTASSFPNKVDPSPYDPAKDNTTYPGKGMDALGNLWISDLKSGTIDLNNSASIASHCFPYDNFFYIDQSVYGMGCRVWGLYDNFSMHNGTLDGYTKGDLPKSVASGGHGQSLVYTWVWSDFLATTYDKSAPDGTDNDCNTDNDTEEAEQYNLQLMSGDLANATMWLTSPCFAPNVNAVTGGNGKTDGSVNPWDHLDSGTFYNSGKHWSNDTSHPGNNLYQANLTSAVPETEVLSEEQLDSWKGFSKAKTHVDPLDPDASGVIYYGSNLVEDFGGSIFSTYIDFNQAGYIQAIYSLVDAGSWDTMYENFENLASLNLTGANLMHLSLQLREVCALVAPTVDSTGNNVAWADRVQNGADNYTIGQSDTYQSNVTPFGSISPMPDSPSPANTQWDSLLQNDPANYYQWNTFGQQAPYAAKFSNSEAVIAGYPTTCIGKCDARYCVGEPSTMGKACADDSFCNGGVCVGVNDGNMSHIADNTTASNAVCTPTLPQCIAKRYYYSYPTILQTPKLFQDQLYNASFIAQGVFEHVFANVVGPLYQLDYQPTISDCITSGSIYCNTDYHDWDGVGTTSKGMGWQVTFDDMNLCPNNVRPSTPGDSTEYCGIVPGVLSTTTPITVDGAASESTTAIDPVNGKGVPVYTVPNGKSILLQFQTTADLEQVPLQHVYIDWGDSSDPTYYNWDGQPTLFKFTHEYSCDASNGSHYNDNNGSSYCVFIPRITVIDNWNWCSGSQKNQVNPDGTIADKPLPPDSGKLNRYNETTLSTDGNYIADCGTYDSPSFSIQVTSNNL